MTAPSDDAIGELHAAIATLRAERDAAVARETALVEVLAVINRFPGDPGPVFDAILEKAHRVCGAAVGALMTYDGRHFRAMATQGYPEQYEAWVRRSLTPLQISHRALLRGERLVHVPDVQAEDWGADADIARIFLQTMRARTMLMVPLRKDGALLGFISAFRNEVRPFSGIEITLLESFAAQAVIAMENARLLDEIRQRQEELRITFENMADGVAMFDETPRLVAWNRKFQEISMYPMGFLQSVGHTPNTSAISLSVASMARGRPGGAGTPGSPRHAGEHRAYERTRPDGRVIEVRHNPVPGGGFVLIYADITERKRSEAEIRAARDAAEEASRTIEAAYRELKAAQANLIQAEKMASLRPTHRRHRARDQEPAELRQQFLRALRRTDRRVAGGAYPPTARRHCSCGGR